MCSGQAADEEEDVWAVNTNHMQPGWQAESDESDSEEEEEQPDTDEEQVVGKENGSDDPDESHLADQVGAHLRLDSASNSTLKHQSE